MSEAQVSKSATGDWEALKSASGARESAGKWNAGQYSTLVDLIKHCDHQIDQANRFHMTAIGSMILILALLMKMNLPLYTHLGIMLLTAALGTRWLTLLSKQNLEKLCWISLARQVEAQLMGDPVGPFMAQQKFFADLPGDLSSGDRIVMRRIGTRKLRYASIILLALALGMAIFAAAMHFSNWAL